MSPEKKKNRIRERLHEIIFEADTFEGKLFDELLLISIVLSVIAASIETVPHIAQDWGHILYLTEWVFTIIFTIEYFTRIYVVLKPWKYVTSFYGLVDLLAIIPTYLSLIVTGTQSLIVIRAIRLLRIFRIFKMAHHLNSNQVIMRSLRVSAPKITVFLYFIFIMVSIFGAIMYLVEGGSNPQFDSIPRSMYWAIVTLTTVGFGDITPQTFIGQFLSAIIMITGYAVIAVPTGIVTSEMITASKRKKLTTQSCRYCSAEGHDNDAKFCKFCGELLHPEDENSTSE